MAQMFPDTIALMKNATSGEKKIFRLLRDVLVPDDDFIVWHELRALDRYSDFIVWSQDFGLLVIEVKDWETKRLLKISPSYFEGTFYKENAVKKIENPILQARNVSHKLLNSILKFKDFVQSEGDYVGKPIFPVGHCVIYSNIKRSEADAIRLSEETISPNSQTFYADDINFDEDNQDKRKEFVRKLKNSFHVKFPFEPLNPKQIAALRFAIFPEIRVNQPTQQELIENGQEVVKALDAEQERVAKSIGEGHRILKGVAGSGKSLVLVCPAKYLSQLYPYWKILVVCFNNTLSNQLVKMIRDESQPSLNNIQVVNFHSLVSSITGRSTYKMQDEDNSAYDVRIGNLLSDHIGLNKDSISQYDAILIDEGQDFVDEWILSLSMLLNPETDSMLFCYDPAQNIFSKKMPTWKSVGLNVRGKRPIKLTTSYRNTKQILDLALRFTSNVAQADRLEEDDYDATLMPEIERCREGDKPSIFHHDSGAENIKNILKKINFLIQQKQHNWSDFGVIVANNPEVYEWVRLFESQFVEMFGDENIDIILGDSVAKKSLDLQKQTLKFLYIESCKGLEFKTVFLIGLENMPRYKRNVEAERKLTYVGITRAQDHLFVIGQNDSGYLKELKQIVELTFGS